MDFEVKDSGKRQQFNSGMVRDTTEGKMRPDLVRDGPMFQRWVTLMTNGAKKYEARNWMKAAGEQEYSRFLESADRHFNIWITWMLYGINIEDPNNPTREPLSEDHGAATFFNINGASYLQDKLKKEKTLSLEWAAGLFEGEGTITIRKRPEDQVDLQLSSTDADVVQLFYRSVGVGKVYGPYKYGIWKWLVNGEQAVELLKQLIPYLGSRRRARAKEAVKRWSERQLRPHYTKSRKGIGGAPTHKRSNAS